MSVATLGSKHSISHASDGLTPKGMVLLPWGLEKTSWLGTSGFAAVSLSEPLSGRQERQAGVAGKLEPPDSLGSDHLAAAPRLLTLRHRAAEPGAWGWGWTGAQREPPLKNQPALISGFPT